MQHVLVESAVKLDTAQVKSLEAILAEKISEKFEAEYAVNEAILGGLRVTIGSKRVDASLRSRLDQVKKQLE